MYVPITSEINIEPGRVLMEISTEQLYSVVEKVKHGGEVSGPDDWRIIPISSIGFQQTSRTISRTELSEKYFAEIEDTFA